MDLCGHATLASAHCLFSNGLVDSEKVEFDTRSGILTAKRVPNTSEVNDGEVKDESFLIELDFPVIPTSDINLNDDSSTMITEALNGVTIVDIKATANNNILVNSKYLLFFFLSLISISFGSQDTLLCRLCFHLWNLSLNCNQEGMIY